MKKGPSKNQGRLNSDIKRELIEIIGGMKDPRIQNGLVTLTRVEAAPDLSSCKVHVSVMGSDESAVAGVVKALNDAKGHVRSEIASKMHIRRAPEFFFIADEGAAYAAHINEILNDLKD